MSRYQIHTSFGADVEVLVPPTCIGTKLLKQLFNFVIPAKAGTPLANSSVREKRGSRLRGNDEFMRKCRVLNPETLSFPRCVNMLAVRDGVGIPFLQQIFSCLQTQVTPIVDAAATIAAKVFVMRLPKMSVQFDLLLSCKCT